MIEFDRVSKHFSRPGSPDLIAVEELSLTVERGETHCLLGTSGCGKTTTLRMVNRLLEPSRGRILLENVDIATVDVIPLRRRIGYVIQKGGIFPHLTVAKNVGLLCELEGWSREKTREKARRLLELVNLPIDDYGGRYPGELSGGQLQRVGIARALALDPPTILMDEPFGALDPITRSKLHDEFLQLKKTMGKTIILVTHDVHEAFKLGDRITLMDRGRVVQSGSPENLRDQPANDFVASFLGSDTAALKGDQTT